MMDQKLFDEMLNALETESKPKERPFWKLDSKFEGEVQIRILPPLTKKGEKLPYFRHQVHYVNNKTYECLNQTLIDSNGETHKAERCPFCEAKEKLYKQGGKGSEEWTIAGKLKPKNVYDYRIVIRNDNEKGNTPFIARIPNGIHDDLMEKLKSKRHGNIMDLEEGRDLVLIKKGQGIASTYSVDLLEKSPVFTSKEDFGNFAKEVMNVDYNVVINFNSFDECKIALDTFMGQDEAIVSEVFERKSSDDSAEKYYKEVIEKEEVASTKPTPKKETAKKDDTKSESIDDMLGDLFG